MVWSPVHTFTIACGTGGAFVDVTALGHVLLDQGGVVRSSGRQSPFSDFTGSTFSFTLDNRDGRYTPDNTAVGATPLSEGMVVAWQTDSRLVSGRIAVGGGLQLIFPDPGQPNSARIRVTVGDMLVSAGRNTFDGGLASALVRAASPTYFWPLDDAADQIRAAEKSGNNGPPLQATLGQGRYSFGADGVPAVGGTQLSIDTNTSPRELGATVGGGISASRGVWMTLSNSTSSAYMTVVYPGATYKVATNASAQWVLTDGTTSVTGPTVIADRPTYVVISIAVSGPATARVGIATLLIDGVSYGSTTSTALGAAVAIIQQGVPLAIGVSSSPDSAQFSHLSQGSNLIHEEAAASTTEAARFHAIEAATPEVTLATLPANLSLSPIGAGLVDSQSALDALNDVIRTEQGQLSTVTTGTVSAPVSVIKVRERTRPTTVTATWTAANEIRPDAIFARDLSNSVSQVAANGVGAEAIVNAPDMVAKVQSANTSFTVLNSQYADVYTAGSDRINRGRKTGIDIVSFHVDGISGTNTDRSADLLALTFGDRHRISVAGAATQLGYSTWDGWLIGVDENWTPTSADFVMYLEPCGLPSAVYDTNRYMANGDLSLQSTINSAVTSMTVTTVGARLSTTATPYTLLLDSEQVTATAVTGATPQVVTMTRGVNGTTAASHTGGALVDIAPTSRYAY